MCEASRHVTWATTAAGPTWAGNGGEEEAPSAALRRQPPPHAAVARHAERQLPPNVSGGEQIRKGFSRQ